ncbi:MAG: response regulator transcription factor [Chloroflexota bacterium]|nr:MAG: DNA-binding response regulator [Chloroflexota bacterium]
MHVLVVEDDQQLAALLKKGLQAEHYTVDVAYDGAAGYDLGVTGAYDVIVTDILLPGKSGTRVTRELRAAGVATPILMLTARDAIEEKVEGFRVGADDYLTKPFAFEEFLVRVAALGRRGRVSLPEEVLRVADLELDTAGHEVRRAGHIVPLGPREYGVLEMLMRHYGRVVSRERLLTGVWGYDSDAYSNVVETSVRRLRNALDRGDDGALIHTVRGVGYKVAE